MNNNLVTKVIYRSICCTVSLFTMLFISEFFSTGGSDSLTFSDDLFYYYTNLSNYLCFGVWLVCLWDDARQLAGGSLRGYNRNPLLRHLKFSATVIISITFIAYGLLLGDPTSLRFWNNIGNLCYHVACPVLFIIDTLAFDEHRRIGFLEPVLATVLPVIYVVVIEIRGSVTGEYPYFFLDMGQLGFGGLMQWIGILLALFLFIGYGIFLWDKAVKCNGKWKFDFSGMHAVGASQ